ncbi:TPA: hypothetical protein N0F65_004715 [Lagenidium giganteum]|uniref:Uncharacterized protein n=1 Tax=Lagenidium giganteum TaxID=4803 RepID=A0AAV2Z4T4_9STRA|nr:TPA: hypothetical protein N0F65_004715 [Lagenidium giganteum]
MKWMRRETRSLEMLEMTKTRFFSELPQHTPFEGCSRIQTRLYCTLMQHTRPTTCRIRSLLLGLVTSHAISFPLLSSLLHNKRKSTTRMLRFGIKHK